MKKIVKKDLKLSASNCQRRSNRIHERKEEPYKVELIEDLPEDADISFYRQGEFTDLCAGPHLMSTKPVKAFKLTSLCRRILERQREKQDAAENLRNCIHKESRA